MIQTAQTIPELTPAQMKRAYLERELRRWRDEEFLRYYVPQPYQLNAHNCLAKRRLDHGGVRSGKTMSEIADIIWRCIGRDFGTGWAKWVPEWINDVKTPQKWRVCSTGQRQSVKKVLVQWFKELTPRFVLEGGKFNYSEMDYQLSFANGSFVEFVSYDQDEGTLSGRPLDGVLFDESHKAPFPIRKQCFNRLIDKHGFARASCCPEDGITWENEWYRKAKDGDSRFATCQFPTVDNKFMYPNQDVTQVSPAIEQIKEDYNHDELMLRVVLYGDFIAIGGLVYFDLHSSTHQLTPSEAGVQANWPIYISVDPGLQKPHAAIWSYVGPGRQFYVFKELEIGRDRVTQTMRELIEELQIHSKGMSIHGITFDPHWEWGNKTAKNERGQPVNLQEDLREAMEFYHWGHMPLLAAPKQKVDAGAGIVRNALTQFVAEERPFLSFHPKAVPETWRQMQQYHYVKPRQTELNTHNPKIAKGDDDFCDCVRILLTAEGVDYTTARPGAPKVESHVQLDEFDFGF